MEEDIMAKVLNGQEFISNVKEKWLGHNKDSINVSYFTTVLQKFAVIYYPIIEKK